MGTIREAIEMVESKEGDLTDFSFLTPTLEQMSDEVSDEGFCNAGALHCFKGGRIMNFKGSTKI